jgi:hypothetical protein
MISVAYFDIGAKRDYMFTAKMSGFKGVHCNESIPFAQNSYLEPKGAPKTDIHPEYYLILPQMFGDDVKSGADEWVYTLKTSVVKKEFKAAGIQEAGKKLDELKMTPRERAAYERYLMAQHDGDAMMKTAVMKGIVKGEARGMKKGEAIGLKKGREEGEAKGRKEGEAKGRKEGEAKGRKEGAEQERRKTALAMKEKGIDIGTIAEITGLPVDAILNL